MAHVPMHPCKYVGCPRLTHQRYCEVHSQLTSQTKRDTRPSAARRGYGRAWQAFRLEHLRIEPQCRHCKARATEVDHITPLSQGGAHLDHRNAQSLCRSCHIKKTRAEQRR